MANFPVVFINDRMRGAPTLERVKGSALAVLDALLLDGWGQLAVDSLTVSDGVATVNLSDVDTFEEDAVILIEGANEEALNTRHRVTGKSDNKTMFLIDLPDGPYTGSMTIKYAPQGSWEKVFSGTNLAVYRSTDPLSDRFYYRINDDNTTDFRIHGYESMSDADTGTNPFFVEGEYNPGDGGSVGKGVFNSQDGDRYDIAADSQAVVFAIAGGYNNINDTYHNAPARGFGDAVRLHAGDGYASFVNGDRNVPQGNGDGFIWGALSTFDNNNSAASCCLARSFYGDKKRVVMSAVPFCSGVGSVSEVPNQSLVFSDIFFTGFGDDDKVRALVPGVLALPMSDIGSTFANVNKTLIQKNNTIRVCRLIPHGGATSQSASSYYLLDLTGPWR